jgi:hypothetical protein
LRVRSRLRLLAVIIGAVSVIAVVAARMSALRKTKTALADHHRPFPPAASSGNTTEASVPEADSEFIAAQREYERRWKAHLATDWAPLSPQEKEARRAALKREMLADAP